MQAELSKFFTEVFSKFFKVHFLKCFFFGYWELNQIFPESNRARIAESISLSERQHTGEICICVEAALDLLDFLRGITVREKAEMLFSSLRVWDTETNAGVLIYINLADRSLEILADRGIATKVNDQQWHEICELTKTTFQSGDFTQGIIECLNSVSKILAEHFPNDSGTVKRSINELSDQPIFKR
ncbi:TPM domain-containing protein [bacterium]|nr:TPM domain-containing protein [bacterium]